MSAKSTSPTTGDPLTDILTSAPTEAWVVAVKAASDIVRDVLAPLTSTTSGLGRLIQSKFDGFIELQRVLSADTLRMTQEKILAAKAEMKSEFNPSVVITCMEESSKQIEQEMRELWADLLARELTKGGIHPEIPRVLARLTSEDAKLLERVSNTIYFRSTRGRPNALSRSIRQSIARLTSSISEDVLKSCGLIEVNDDGHKSVTNLGKALLAAVAPLAEDGDSADDTQAAERPLE